MANHRPKSVAPAAWEIMPLVDRVAAALKDKVDEWDFRGQLSGMPRRNFSTLDCWRLAAIAVDLSKAAIEMPNVHGQIYQACVDYMAAYESGNGLGDGVRRLLLAVPADEAAVVIVRDLLDTTPPPRTNEPYAVSRARVWLAENVTNVRSSELL